MARVPRPVFMNSFLYPLSLLAGAGLALSAAAHAIAWAGMSLPGGSLVWALHIGVFVVWIPTVLVCIKTTRYADRNDFWKVALSGCPPWMRKALYVLVGYAVCNFIVQILTTTRGVQTMSDAPPAVIRGFSGHWMVFYCTAFCVLYSSLHAPHLPVRESVEPDKIRP